MAPRGGARTREADYSKIGVAGRRTGITLKDTGQRDEHGLEPIDGLFSSPEKSPMKRNGVNHNATIAEEESMDTGESTIPEPTEVLAARRKLPPPKARSPMKTALNSSPRRSLGPRSSIGPRSSPARHSSATPVRATSHSAVSRKLDFSVDEPRQSIERSPNPPKTKDSVMNGPRLAPNRPKAGKLLSTTAKGKRRIFDLSMEDEEEDDLEAVEGESALVQADVGEASNAQPAQDDGLDLAETQVTGVGGDSELPVVDVALKPKSRRGRPRRSLPDESVPPAESDTVFAQAAEPKRRGRKPKQAPVETADDEIEARGATAEDIAAENALAARIALRKKKALAAAAAVEEAVTAAEEETAAVEGVAPDEAPDDVSDEAEVIEAKPKSRKRKGVQADPPSDLQPEPQLEPQPLDIFDIDSQLDIPESSPPKPAKRAKTTKGVKASAALEKDIPAEAPPAQVKREKQAKKPPKERDANARITSRKAPKSPAPPARANLVAGATTIARPTARSLQVIRSETPAQDAGSQLLRSGRHSIKPLAYWRGERALYGDMSLEGKQVVLPAIKEIIRTEEILPELKKRGQARKKGRKKRVVREEESSSEEEFEDEVEAWELEDGVLTHETLMWDSRLMKGSLEDMEETEIAFSPLYVASASREVQGGNFRFAKTLTLPFFGSGIVDLPPGGEKRIKNARRMQMVFFVFSGRVRVTVNELPFGVGKGGMWVVPRGNMYGIQNVSTTRPARMFFAQACQTSEEEEALREEGAAGAE